MVVVWLDSEEVNDKAHLSWRLHTVAIFEYTCVSTKGEAVLICIFITWNPYWAVYHSPRGSVSIINLNSSEIKLLMHGMENAQTRKITSFNKQTEQTLPCWCLSFPHGACLFLFPYGVMGKLPYTENSQSVMWPCYCITSMRLNQRLLTNNLGR